MGYVVCLVQFVLTSFSFYFYYFFTTIEMSKELSEFDRSDKNDLYLVKEPISARLLSVVKKCVIHQITSGNFCLAKQ